MLAYGSDIRARLLLDKSASTSGDRAGYGQSGEGKADNYVPEHPILFTSDSGAEKQDAQKQELELEDSKKYSKHPPPPSKESTTTGAVSWEGFLIFQIFPHGEATFKCIEDCFPKLDSVSGFRKRIEI